MRAWRFLADKEKKGEDAGWLKPDFDDSQWKITDPAVETWSTIGHHSYMGSMWYRTRVNLPAIPADKKVFLWLGATDGSAKVFVNGTHIPFINAQEETMDIFSGYCTPALFEVSPAIRRNAENQISILCERTFVNELGTGGLLAPVVICRERD
ncbi:MAG: beta galactosidase jelly roll domain-containing protein [Planctomycetota bacterium]|nr:beta galactosidase jelly roll domain-containing protein [Planctomycetota bacterium]